MRMVPGVATLLRRILLLPICLGASATEPERKIERNVIVSERDPQIRVELPAFAQYAGGDRFVLYDIADCELHAFVKADAAKVVQRLYWVQFEQYLPDKP